MENIKEFICCLCKEPLDGNPRACCDQRICGACFAQIEIRPAKETCPLCPVPSCGEVISNKEDHFQRDRHAAKEMRRLDFTCKACGQAMKLSNLREHRKVCKQLEEDIQGDEGQGQEGIEDNDQELELRHREAEMQEEQLPAQQLAVADLPDEPIRNCQYRPFGCLFQGTKIELRAHRRVPTTKECMVAQMLASLQKYACTRQQEIDNLELWLHSRGE